MSERQATENTTTAISEDKLFGLLLLGLGAVLLIALLVWRALDKEAENDLVPTADEKHAIWFDESGVVRKTNTAPSSPEQATQPALVDLQKQTTTESRPIVTEQGLVNYWIQLASFSHSDNAEALRDKVSASALSVEVVENQRGERTIYAVRVLVSGDKAKAEKLSQSIAKRYGLKPLVMQAK